MNSGFLVSRPLIIGVNLIAFVLLVWVIASSTLKVLNYYAQRTSNIQTEPSVNPNPRTVQPVQMNQIIAAHLFGRPEQKKQPVQTEAPKTRLNLSLTGVIASADPRYARAIIAAGSKPAKSYGVGDVLDKSDVKLHSIEANKVLLERNGKLESLAMARNQLRGANSEQLQQLSEPTPPLNQPETLPDEGINPDDELDIDDEDLPAGLRNLNEQLERLDNNAQAS